MGWGLNFSVDGILWGSSSAKVFFLDAKPSGRCEDDKVSFDSEVEVEVEVEAEVLDEGRADATPRTLLIYVIFESFN